MATPALRQTIGPTTFVSVSTITETFPSAVLAGSALVVVWSNGTANRTWTPEDDINGSPNVWTKISSRPLNTLSGQVAYYLNTAAGTPTITMRISASTGQGVYVMYEITDADEVDQGDADGFEVLHDVTNHSPVLCYPTPVPFSDNSIVLYGYRANANPGTVTAQDGQTWEYQVGLDGLAYKIYTTGATEDMSFTTGTARRSYTGALSLKAAAAPGGFQAAWARGATTTIVNGISA